MGLSAMHARLMHMFCIFPEFGHEVNMDNLFHSVLFSIAARSICENKVKTQGVIQKSQRGVTPLVLQEPLPKKAEEKVWGTIKAAVLRGDSRSHDLIVASCYDQKPFYVITNIQK